MPEMLMYWTFEKSANTPLPTLLMVWRQQKKVFYIVFSLYQTRTLMKHGVECHFVVLLCLHHLNMYERNT